MKSFYAFLVVLSLSLASNSYGQQGFDLSLSTWATAPVAAAAGLQHVKLILTPNRRVPVTGNGDWGSVSIWFRVPKTLTPAPLAGGDASQFVNGSNAGFTALGMVDPNGGAPGISGYDYNDLSGVDDGFVYYNVANAASPVNRNYTAGAALTIYEFDVPQAWTCASCMQIVTTALVPAPTGMGSYSPAPYIGFSESGVAYDQAKVVVNSQALPVDLVSFTAAKGADCSAQLQWKTATETNSSKYVIEYSNGSAFSEAATVASKNSSTGATYSYNVSNISNGNAIFRLKMVDKDGGVKYSENRSVTVACVNGKIVVLPNPVKDKITVRGLTGLNNTIRVYSATGQLLLTKQTSNAIENLNANGYAKGSYLVVVTNAEGKNVGSVKVVK